MDVWVPAVVIVLVLLPNILVYLGNGNNTVLKTCWEVSRHSLLVVCNKRTGLPLNIAPSSFWAWDLIAANDLHNGSGGAPLMALYRFFCFMVFCLSIIVGRVLEGEYPKMLTFFTDWTFCLWGFLSILGGSLSAQAWHRRHHQQSRPTAPPCGDEKEQDQGQEAWRAVDKAHLLLLETICTSSVALTVFYWAGAYKPGEKVGFDNPLKHGVSAFLLLVELFISRVPLVSYHLQAPIGYGSLYLVFMWIYQAATQEWLYAALDWTKPLSIGFYIALPVLLTLAFCVMFLVAGLRELIITRSCFLQSCCCSCCCCVSTSSCSQPVPADLVEASDRSSLSPNCLQLADDPTDAVTFSSR